MTERASPARKSRGRGDRQALCQSDTIAAQSCLAAALPSQSGLRPPAPPKGEPLAEWKTLNWEGKLCGLPKPPLGRGGGTASAVTERLSPAAAHGQALSSYNLSVCFADSSPSRGASGETVHFARPAKASPFGRGVTEGDGEGKPGTKEPLRSDRQALCQSDTIAVSELFGSSLALSGAARQLSQRESL